MKLKVDAIVELMANDYAEWCHLRPQQFTKDEMKEEFIRTTVINVGKKYIKLIKTLANGEPRHVCGFIVNVYNDEKFQYGDMLKPSGWATPARNFSRGNVFNNVPNRVDWTGI